MLIAADRNVDLAGIFVRLAVNERDVRFVNRPLAKLFGQSLVDLVIFCNDDQARGVFVEAVDDADFRF